MPNPATSLSPRQPGPWDAVKITNRPNGIAGMLGFKRVVILLDGVESEPIWNVLENDPLTTLQAGEVIEAYFKSEDKVKKLGIISIDCRMDAALGGYDVTITTQEWTPGLAFVPGSTVNGPPGQNNIVKPITDPNAACFKPISDIDNIIYGCNCTGFKRGNGVSFDSQDAYELGWKSCPCCKKPFKTRTGQAASYATPVVATTAKSASYLPDDVIITAPPTYPQKLSFVDLLKNWKTLYGQEFTEVLKTPEFREALANTVKEQTVKEPEKKDKTKLKGICMRCNAPTNRIVLVGYVCEKCA